MMNHAQVKDFAFAFPSSQVNIVTDEDEKDAEEDDLINEGIVGKKYIALRPYIKEMSTSKHFKEQNAHTQENRVLIPRSDPALIVKVIKVLCVDDSSYNLFLMKELLCNIEGIKVDLDTAMHGQEAI
jgi:hypothetical protein